MSLNNLSDELFLEIVEIVDCDEKDRVKTLKACCLVNRRWLRFSQPLLYERIAIRESGQLVKLHQTLTGTTKLARFVRDLDFTPEINPIHQHFGPDQLIADCLEHTMELEQLSLQLSGQDLITNLIAFRICSLPKLAGLAIMPDSDKGYHERFKLEPRLLLALPKTLQELELYGPPDDLMDLLPEICEKIHSPVRIAPPGPDSPRLFIDTGKRANFPTGLRSLVIDTDFNPGHDPKKIFKALGHSLAPTLQSFTLDSPLEETLLIDFLSAIPLLRYLQINSIRISPVLFDGLPSLTQLLTLEMDVDQEVHRPDWDGFYRSLGNFLSHSPHLQTFSFPQDDAQGLCTTKLIDVLIESTTKHGCLRSLFGRDEPISSLLTLEISNSSVPSIEALERLCQSAPLLEYLEIALPLDHLPRAATAIGSLKHLASAELRNSSLSTTCSVVRGMGGEPIDLSFLVPEMTPPQNPS